MKTSDYNTRFPRVKRLTLYLCAVVVLCLFNLNAVMAQDQVNQTNTPNTQPAPTVEKPVQLESIDVQNNLQRQQQSIQLMSNISKVLRDTALAIIRKIG